MSGAAWSSSSDGKGGVPESRNRVSGKSGKSGKSGPLPSSRRLVPIADNLRA
jgi:hypothetical protein